MTTVRDRELSEKERQRLRGKRGRVGRLSDTNIVIITDIHLALTNIVSKLGFCETTNLFCRVHHITNDVKHLRNTSYVA